MIEPIVDILSLPWVGTVAGIFGVGLAVFSYFRTKRSPRLAYQISEFSVVGGLGARFPQELEISFAGTKVDRVTSSRIVLWNDGNTTFDREQIVSSDPLRFQLSEGRILQATIQNTTRDVNGVTLDSPAHSRGSVTVDFDYLDPRDGCAITIIHSGPRGSISCKGTLKELPGGPTQIRSSASINLVNVGWVVSAKRGGFVLWAPIVVGVIAMIIGLFAPQVARTLLFVDSSTIVVNGPVWAVVGTGFVYASLPAMWLWYYRRRYPATLQEPPLSTRPKRGRVEVIRNVD